MLHIAIGDVHGCYDKLVNLLDVIEREYKDGTYTLVFLGDYIDRGPDSNLVLEVVKRYREEKGAVALKGNHEDLAFDFGPLGQQIWLQNGGVQTLQSYGWRDIGDDLDYSNARGKFYAANMWLKELPTWYETDRHYFVHAGIAGWESLEDQTDEYRLWIRDDFLKDKHKHPKYVIHGHTPGYEVDVCDNRCNLDSGAVFGGKLSAGVFSSEQDTPIRIIGV
jgi:serine/threonine protein phosphatase 1